MPDLGVIFTPIVWLMDLVLGFYVGVTGTAWLSILLLSATFSLLLWPLQRLGLRGEQRLAAKMRVVTAEVQELRRQGLKGEALFEATEKIYQQHKYHPIHAMMGAASFLVALPVLISSIILLHSTPLVVGQPFLFVADLSQPDQVADVLGFPINLLPLLMFAVTFVDMRLRYADDPAAQRRFLVVSAVLLVLVYTMPAGLVLYWIGNNLTSLALARVFRPRTPVNSRA